MNYTQGKYLQDIHKTAEQYTFIFSAYIICSVNSQTVINLGKRQKLS